jgi:2'-5' RNA ligase
MTLDLLALAEALLAAEHAPGSLAEALLAEANLSGGEHGMVAFYPAPELARKLAVDGGEKAEDLHVTLAFLGKDFLPEGDARAGGLRMLQGAVMRWASRTGPMRGVIAGRGLFTEGPKPVTYLVPDVPALPDARERLVGMLAAAGYPARTDHGYSPHLTVAYDDLSDYRSPRGVAIEFDQVTLVVGDTRYSFPLTGSNPPTDADRHVEAAWLEVFIESNLTDHAKSELKRAGLMDKDSDYGGMLGNAVLKLMKTFSGEGHSGTSAMMALELFKKLAMYEPLTPLTDDLDEWMNVSHESFTKAELTAGKVMFQSRRHPGAFSDDGGKTYYILDDPANYRPGTKADIDPDFPDEIPKEVAKPRDQWKIYTAKPRPVREGFLTAGEARAASRASMARANPHYAGGVGELFPLDTVPDAQLAGALLAVGAQLDEALPTSLQWLYAYLALTKGALTTREDVHDAWAAWKQHLDPGHEDLRRFDELTRDDQAKDQPYVDAIHAAARTLR